jgi:hypothetical protein
MVGPRPRVLLTPPLSLAYLQETLHERISVGVACCYRCRLFKLDQSNHNPRTAYIYKSTLHPPKLCSRSASWRWASDVRNMSRIWILTKWKWMWSVSSWCVLLNYTMMHGHQNMKCRTSCRSNWHWGGVSSGYFVFTLSVFILYLHSLTLWPVWATDVFAFSSIFLSVDGMTCHISF